MQDEPAAGSAAKVFFKEQDKDKGDNRDMDIREAIRQGQYLVFDGGMGTMLQAAGLEPGTMPEEWNLTHAEAILKVHRAYVGAGADIITTNTFGANARKCGAGYADMIRSAIRIAKDAGARFVAQDIGPTGLMLRPLGEADFDEAYELFRQQVEAGTSGDGPHPDLFIIETMTDLLEMKAAVLAVREHSDLPVIATMSYEKTGRTFLGVSAAAATVTLCGLGVDAVGVNCSLGPGELGDIVEEICRYSTVPVVVQANAGLPESIDGRTVFNVGPEEYIEAVKGILRRCEDADLDMVRILGGCCGTEPEYIRLERALADSLAVKEVQPGPRSRAYRACACSASVVTEYDNHLTVVGERLNPTGKKRISAALREGDYDLLLSEAITEYECGAEILDVNAGLPDIDEADVLPELISRLQGVCSLPLQIDTTNPEALERAVRRYNGRPIINSANGTAESMATVFPIAAKYGAAVICLPLDEDGIPGSADGRLAIAKRMAARAAEYGVPEHSLIIDGLVMTVSTNQTEVKETLKTLALVRSRLHLHTCLGVSNISFGMPNREVLNAVFLAQAALSGLELAIIDPTKERYMQTVYAHRSLCGEDENSAQYIEYSVAHPLAAKADRLGQALQCSENAARQSAVRDGAGGTAGPLSGGDGMDAAAGTNERGTAGLLAGLIISGNKAAVAEKTRELLLNTPAMDIISREFIPALDRVGELYEQGTIFLPQLMSAAEAAKRGFDIIKQADEPANADGNEVQQASATGTKASDTAADTDIAAGETIEGRHTPDGGLKIVLATVRGDIHDIGKNIVGMLLENYGYDVTDLGKDVPAETIVAAVKEHNARLVGLSALMTTTVRSMEETIKALRKECPECKIVVGGAVLNEGLAERIGADYYAKDAAETARIAALCR